MREFAAPRGNAHVHDRPDPGLLQQFPEFGLTGGSMTYRQQPRRILRHGANPTQFPGREAVPPPEDLPLACTRDECFAVNMTDKESPSDLPDDPHLRDDVAPGTGTEPAGTGDDRFTPGQTNAGQQVAGLASATDYGAEDDPESQQDSNHPV